MDIKRERYTSPKGLRQRCRGGKLVERRRNNALEDLKCTHQALDAEQIITSEAIRSCFCRRAAICRHVHFEDDSILMHKMSMDILRPSGPSNTQALRCLCAPLLLHHLFLRCDIIQLQPELKAKLVKTLLRHIVAQCLLQTVEEDTSAAESS